ncbi:MAG: hypothetical protein ACM3JL_00185 [Nitrososphaerota archaeon]
MARAMVEVTEAMPVRRAYLNGLARFQSKAQEFLRQVAERWRRKALVGSNPTPSAL